MFTVKGLPYVSEDVRLLNCVETERLQEAVEVGLDAFLRYDPASL